MVNEKKYTNYRWTWGKVPLGHPSWPKLVPPLKEKYPQNLPDDTMWNNPDGLILEFNYTIYENFHLHRAYVQLTYLAGIWSKILIWKVMSSAVKKISKGGVRIIDTP